MSAGVRRRLRAFPAMTMLVTFSEAGKEKAQLRPKQQATHRANQPSTKMVTLSSPGGCVPRQTLLVRRSQSATARYVQISQDSHQLAFRRSSGSNGR